MIREIQESDLEKLLNLYLFLHEEEVPVIDADTQSLWHKIINDPNHHIIVVEENDEMLASCVCVIIPNLTRNTRPYAIIENVVTHEKCRNRGYATACLNLAKEIAQEEGCYKMMLMTSSKTESTHNFYRSAGYNSDDKTAYIQWL